MKNIWNCPFNIKTTIRCYIPQSVSKAVIKIYSLNGEELRSFVVSSKGINQIEIEGGALASGTCNYLLIADGKTIDTKQMILTK